MFRAISSRLSNVAYIASRTAIQRQVPVITTVRHSHKVAESAEEFDARYVKFFDRSDIDSWEIRKAINDLQGYDMVPDPKIIISAMKACRRLNDYGLAVRYLEAVKDKCGPKVAAIWPYILTQIQPTLDELGILTPEAMGYDKPELAMQDVMDM